MLGPTRRKPPNEKKEGRVPAIPALRNKCSGCFARARGGGIARRKCRSTVLEAASSCVYFHGLFRTFVIFLNIEKAESSMRRTAAAHSRSAKGSRNSNRRKASSSPIRCAQGITCASALSVCPLYYHVCVCVPRRSYFRLAGPCPRSLGRNQDGSALISTRSLPCHSPINKEG